MTNRDATNDNIKGEHIGSPLQSPTKQSMTNRDATNDNIKSEHIGSPLHHQQNNQ
jgi:hypothetical protein